ncbi:hypothetical protein ACF081_06885 [Streptomyces longwoodensis]|uniref:hypothetical protein n=1 Tax=Streptomyces longwoodensis TaxID=68231 RepID=UPI0036FF1DFC
MGVGAWMLIAAGLIDNDLSPLIGSSVRQHYGSGRCLPNGWVNPASPENPVAAAHTVRGELLVS